MQQRPTEMSKKTSLIARRPWNLLRLALVFRERLAISLNILQKVIRKLAHSNESRRALAYGDHEFSFGSTPIIHVKMHRPSTTLRFKMPHIPCIKPQVDFDYYDEADVMMSDDGEMWCDENEYDHVQSACTLKDEDEEDEEEMNEDCDEEIDSKAEEFIAKFYEQMKLQRQISYLEYNGNV